MSYNTYMLTIDIAKNKSLSSLTVYITHLKKKANGQLVVLGFDVSTFTPAPYQRCRLQRP